MIIDAHAHVLPDRFPARDGWPSMGAAEPDGARELRTGRMRYRAAEVFFTAERRVEAAEAVGVGAEVVSPMPPILDYRTEAKEARDLDRWINEFVAGLAAAYPDRIFGLGTVPLQDPDLAAAELTEVRALGLYGVEIASHIDGRSLGEDRFRAFFAEAARLGLSVFVHAMPSDLGGRLPAAALGTYGVGVEGTLAAASLIASGTAEAVPDLRLAFSHAAGGFALTLPRAQYFWGGTWNEEPPADRTDLAEHAPLELARRFFYDALVFDRRALRLLVDLLGADRLLIGSDFPAMPREDPADRTPASLGLDAADTEAVTSRNALRFLGVAP